MRKIGIIGGTFDPVHTGHTSVCRHVMDEMGLDLIIFIPSCISPHKQGEITAGPEKRLRMLDLALKEEAGFLIDTFEVESGRISYSIDTIRHLKKKYAGDELYWIIGADMLFYIENWHDHVNVLRMMRFIAVKREGYDDSKMAEYISELHIKYGADIRLSSSKPVDISSTMVRCMVRDGKSIKNLVHEDVERYIIENSLYIS